jgi:hypothetical protein
MQINPAPQSPQKHMPSGVPKPKKHSVLPSLLFMVGVLVVMINVLPKEPLSRAATSVQSPDGQAITGAPPADYQGLVISEVMSANSSAVPDENGEYNDWLELWNKSEHPKNLKGVGLSDRADRVLFLFPNVVLKPDGRLVVFASNTNNADPNGTLHANFKLSAGGETVYLFDPGAYVIDKISLPIMNSDVSYALQEDGTYKLTQEYSPGFENTEEGYLNYRNASAVSEGAIRISEIMASPRTGIYDEDGDLSDWSELYNTTGQSISLKGFALSDKENDPLKWRFPDDAVIPAHGYYLVFCSGKDRLLAADKISHTNFRLSSERETVILSDSQGRLIDRAYIDNLPLDTSLGRDDEGNWKVLKTATPGMPNNEAGAAQAEKNMLSANMAGVYISEVMSSNDGGNDWVELYNASTQSFYLEGCGLSDSLNRPRKWQFPAGASIGPGEYMIVNLDGSNSQAGGYHTNFKLLRAGGEVMCFSDPNGRVLDKVSLPLIPTNISFGRTIGLAGFFYYDAPTMGTVNGTGFLGFAETPEFSIKGGLYYDPVLVSITVPEGTTVRYTLDGSIPTQQHPKYDGSPITVNITSPLRARAFKDGLQPSEVITQTYFINVYHKLPVVSLVADPNELWNELNGMLVEGPNIDKSGGPKFKNAIYREFGRIPRPGFVEYYTQDGTQVLSQGIEFGLFGQYSLDMPQKSFKVRAKASQGAPYFEASLFADRPYTEYKSFVLRNGGNDNVWTRINDDFQSRLLDKLGTTVIHQATNPVVVYLNGQYWGHYNMRERVDRFFVAQHEGLPLDEADNMDILEANSTVFYGSDKEYKALIKKAESLSPGKNPEDLKYITDRIDVDNYFDYQALEWFFGNTDPGNIRYYRLKGEGQKWRWIFYDSDYGLFKYTIDSPTSYLDPKGAGVGNFDNTLIRKLLENNEMKEKFVRRLGEIFQLFTTKVLTDTFNELASQIEPEMKLHFARWAELNEKTINVDSPLTAEGAMHYWQTRLDRSRNIFKIRPNYFYGYIQDYFKLSDATMTEYFGEKPPIPLDAIL